MCEFIVIFSWSWNLGQNSRVLKGYYSRHHVTQSAFTLDILLGIDSEPCKFLI